MKRILSTVFAILFSSALIFVVPAFYLFVSYAAENSQDCSQFVIDSYEVHSGVDIPKVNAINCYYDMRNKVRLSVYLLDTQIDTYLQRHKFVRNPARLDQLINMYALLDESELPVSAQLYTINGGTWKYVVERETGKMWVEMAFR